MKNTEEKILCRTPFRSSCRSLVCARLGSKGKVGVQRGRKTAGCPSFLPSAVGTANPRAPQSAAPRCGSAKNFPPVRGEHANAVRAPRLSGAGKGAARQGRTRLRQFVCPGFPVQEKRSRPSGANPPAAVRVPRSASAEKEPPVRGEPACGSSCALATLCREKKHRRIASTVLKVCTFTQIAAAYRHPYAPAPAGPVPDDRAR